MSGRVRPGPGDDGPLPTASSAARTRSSRSASVSVGLSPVVPATTTPSEPLSTRCRASAWNASKSTAPFSLNGVTIAVRTFPSTTRFYAPPAAYSCRWPGSSLSTAPGTAAGASTGSRPSSGVGVTTSKRPTCRATTRHSIRRLRPPTRSPTRCRRRRPLTAGQTIGHVEARVRVYLVGASAGRGADDEYARPGSGVSPRPARALVLAGCRDRRHAPVSGLCRADADWAFAQLRPQARFDAAIAPFGRGDVVVIARQDDAVDPSWQLRTARAHGARVEELDAGHFPMLTHPRDLADLLVSLSG